MKQQLLYGLVGIVAGIAIAQLTGFFPSNTSVMKKDATLQNQMGMGSSMDAMMESMEGKRDNEFDKAFIDAMLAHHEGAIEMAHEALKYGKHDEVKKLASDIITAQENEINMMKFWKEQWQY